MSITIDRLGRDAVWGEAMVELSAIGDIYLLASRGDIDGALTLRARQLDVMRLLDAVGWAEHDEPAELALDTDPWHLVAALAMIATSATTAQAADDERRRDDADLGLRRELAIVTSARLLGELVRCQSSAGGIGGVS
jgi:hypothetical protein